MSRHRYIHISTYRYIYIYICIYDCGASLPGEFQERGETQGPQDKKAATKKSPGNKRTSLKRALLLKKLRGEF